MAIYRKCCFSYINLFFYLKFTTPVHNILLRSPLTFIHSSIDSIISCSVTFYANWRCTNVFKIAVSFFCELFAKVYIDLQFH
ncbi:hypothetical protein FKM82_012653 [Ascaphus truei]